MNQPMATPPVYAAAPADVRSAVDGIRQRVSGLAEPRLYQVAVALTVLSGTGEATRWHSWGSPPPGSAQRFARAQLVGAMWQLFGTATGALLHPGSSVGVQLGNPQRVLLDVLYGANGPLTLVGSTRIAVDSRRDSAKLTIDHGSWLWSSSGAASPPVKVAEYNPVNSLGQQNGIGCALPASSAMASAPNDPASIYAVSRPSCPKHKVVIGSEPICTLNNAVCGGQGDGAARETTKPRLLAPPTPGSDAFLVLPGTITALVAQATRGGSRSLPRASDLSLLVSWCHTDGSGAQDASRLASLLGGAGIKLLTSTT